jgi:hypothetical protein
MAFVDTVDISNMGHKILLYGPPKQAGKTHAAGEVAEFFPKKVIWLDLEGGFKTLKRLPLETQANINLIQIPDSRETQLAVRSLDEITRKKGAISICDVHGRLGSKCIDCSRYPDSGGTIQTIDFSSLNKDWLVVLDSVTQLSYSALAFAIETWDPKYRNLSDKDLADIAMKPELDHYGRQGFLLARIFVFMQQSKANWIVISHDIDIDKRDKFTKLVPSAGTSNFSKNFAKYFDHVVYMNMSNGKFNQNSSVLKEANILSGSRTGVDLQVGVSSGIIDLIRTVRNSKEEKEAKKSLDKIVAPMAEPEQESSRPAKKTLAEMLAEKAAKKEERKA